MKYFLLAVSCLSLYCANGQSNYTMSYYVDRVVKYNSVPTYSAEEVLYRRDEYVRFQGNKWISEKDQICAWIDFDIGWSVSNLEIGYKRLFQGLSSGVFFRRNTFYCFDYENYPDDYENQPIINQAGLSLGYGQERRFFSYQISPQITIGHDSKWKTFDRTEYTDSNFRALNEEVFQIRNFRTAGIEIQLSLRLINREKWNFGISYQCTARRDFYDFANKSSRYEWSRQEVVRSDSYVNKHRYDRIQNHFGFVLRIP